jgi:hypothetical protein
MMNNVYIYTKLLKKDIFSIWSAKNEKKNAHKIRNDKKGKHPISTCISIPYSSNIVVYTRREKKKTGCFSHKKKQHRKKKNSATKMWKINKIDETSFFALASCLNFLIKIFLRHSFFSSCFHPPLWQLGKREKNVSDSRAHREYI